MAFGASCCSASMSDRPFSDFGPGDPYPERRDNDDDDNALERIGAAVAGRVSRAWRSRRKQHLTFAADVHAAETEFADLEPQGFRDAARAIALDLRSEGLTRSHCARAFALIRRTAQAVLGLDHFDVQLMGGWVIVQGMIAEMATGEGKTLTATLPAATAALAGWPVHVISVNDYLVERDCTLLRPLYEALGLSVSMVVMGMSHEERQQAYLSDIVYVSNKTVVFDYLRDRIVVGPNVTPMRLQIDRMVGKRDRTKSLLLRGLYFAIVDEADSVLVDEARTPLIISGESERGSDEAVARAALELAGQLEAEIDYNVRKGERRVVLTEGGRQRLIDLCHARQGIWAVGLRREELVLRALSAMHLYHLEEHYLIREGKIQIVDEFTGRVMPDRSWSQGLHQMIEVKEGCEVTRVNETLARISYQRFFRRYLRLSGMTGTAREVRGELGSVYRLPVLRIPTNRPCVRVYHPDRIYASTAEKWEAIADRVAELNARSVPVLIGTRSVRASESAREVLERRGLEVTVLNAKQDNTEAEIVALAGNPGRITIATNMAGRGTDIALHEDVRAQGGLYVILTERHEAGRIDRQLAGRAARQGDPGSFEAFLSLEDALLDQIRNQPIEHMLRGLAARRGPLGKWAQGKLLSYAQGRAERENSRIRRQLLKSDRYTSQSLSFTGQTE